MQTTQDQPGARATMHSTDVLTEVETTYLDLDGDGVPDAVQTVEAVAIDLDGDGVPDIVEVVEAVADGIGVDGVPYAVEVIERIEIELEHETPSG